MLLPPTTIKEHNFKKQRALAWDFRTGKWAKKPPLTKREEAFYRHLHHVLAATWYIAHQNIKTYKILYPLCALASLGAMAAICAGRAPAPVKVAGMVALPLYSATLIQRRDKAVGEARQAKKECRQLLGRFKDFNQMPTAATSFAEEYPAMYAQSNTLRARLIRKIPVGPFLFRHWADLGADLCHNEHCRG